MAHLRSMLLSNLDLAGDIALDTGVKILTNYDDLKFYLKKIAFGHKNKLKAAYMVKFDENMVKDKQ